MPVLFQCPECGQGDYEVRHLTDGAEAYGIVCQEDVGCLFRLRRWEEAEQPHARLRLADAA